MDGLAFVLVLAAAALGYAAWKHYFSHRGRLLRAMRSAPLCTVRQAPDGALAKLVGRLRLVEDQPYLAAPLSGRPCALYEVEVIHHKDKHRSTIVAEIEHHDRFWLEDDTGRALVQIVRSDLALHVDRRYTSGVLDEPTPVLRDFLAARGHSAVGWVFNKNLEYREAVLEPGERVAALGFCRWEPDPDPTAASTGSGVDGHGGGYRTAPMRLVLTAPAGGALLLSDEPAALESIPRARRLAGGPRRPG